MPLAHACGCFAVSRQMHMLALLRADPFLQNCVKIGMRGSVEQVIGGNSGDQFQINSNGMALRRANSLPVVRQRKPALVIFRDDLVQHFPGDRMADRSHPTEEVIHQNPTTGAKAKPHKLGLVAQNK